MYLCHLKNSDTEPKTQKYKVRVVLQGDVAKGYSDGHDVHGAGLVSVTKKKATKVLDVVARLSGYCRTHERRRIRLRTSENEGRVKSVETSEIEMSRY